MTLKLRTIGADGIVSVASQGAIADQNLLTDNNPFEQLLGSNWAGLRISLDLSDTPHINSVGLAWLIESQRRFKQAGGRFVVHSVQPTVRQAMDLLKLDQVIPLAANEAAAREALKS
jgi:anti-anti-sigma factor